MTTFEDLLGAVRNLNDPTRGVTSDWKSHLRDAESQAPEVKTNVKRLSAFDDKFNTELHPFINNTAPDNTTLAKLIALIESYLAQTKGLYDSLLNLKYSKASDKKTVENIRDAYSNVHETLQKVKASLLVVESQEIQVPNFDPNAITFKGIIGGPNPSIQEITITNNGDSLLSWGAEGIDDVPWLMVSPLSGGLGPGDNVTVEVAAIFPKSPLECGSNMHDMVIGYDYPHASVPQAKEHQPQRGTILVTFDVYQPCTIYGSTSSILNFDVAKGQKSLSTLTITANGTGDSECIHDLTWTAVSTAPWLTFDPKTPSTGTVSSGSSAQTTIVVNSSDLDVGTYSAAIILTAVDSIDNQPVPITGQQGTSQIIAATLAVKPPCSLGLPSPSCLTFSTEAGGNPALQSFTIGIDGECTDSITITANATTDQDGNYWLQVTPTTQKITGNVESTITVSIASAQLLPGPYTGSISILAKNGQGNVLEGSPTVDVSLNVIAAPALLVSPSSGLDFKEIVGKSSQTITIKNTGGESLQWQASLANNAPGFVDLSANSGLIQGGASAFFNVTVDATGITVNATYSTSVIISATDPTIPLNSVVGSPVSVPITINIASDALFLTVMKQLNLPNSLVVRQTEQLFKREDLTLNDLEIDQLTKSWDKVVACIADPSRNTIIKNARGITDTALSDLFTLHTLLEQLYDRIESNVTRSDVEIIGQ